MQIKLYRENDTRPVGAYEWCSVATASPFSIYFESQTGVKILTNLRYKITLDEGDIVRSSVATGLHEIEGAAKPSASSKHESPILFPEVKGDYEHKTSKPFRSQPVPTASSYAGPDPDEVTCARPRRTPVAGRDRRQQSDSLQVGTPRSYES